MSRGDSRLYDVAIVHKRSINVETAEAQAARRYVAAFRSLIDTTAEAPAARRAHARGGPLSVARFTRSFAVVLLSPAPASRLPLRVPPRTAHSTATAPHSSPASRLALSERSPRPSRGAPRPRCGLGGARHRTVDHSLFLCTDRSKT
ncbi:hypothetical protein DM2_965 [Halorubrum sp. DM2]|nr:hypothetical protein DM2_965 [Halorubrum sp. DM2]